MQIQRLSRFTFFLQVALMAGFLGLACHHLRFYDMRTMVSYEKNELLNLLIAIDVYFLLADPGQDKKPPAM